MTSQTHNHSRQCASNELSAYIDGELSADEEARLELHLKDCADCRLELNEQKKFLTALNSSLEDEARLELPENFTKVVVTNAESRVSGLSGTRDRLNAICICAALLLFALFALGGESSVLGGAGSLLEKLGAVGGFVAHFFYDAALGIIVVFKSLSSRFLFDSPMSVVALLALFALSLFIFSRLLFRRRRTQEN